MSDTKNTSTSEDSSSPEITLSQERDSEESGVELTGKDFPVEAEALAPIGIVVDEEDEEEKPLIEEALVTVETFEELNLAEPLMAAIKTIGWTKPTLIQGMGLPLTTKGQDLAGFSQTGTGKTGVFLITIAHQILKMREAGVDDSKGPKAIILAPTRELAVQISSDADLLFSHLNISSMAVFGGVDYEKQASTIKAGVDVIVATPGRLKDYYQKKIFSTKDCCLFICDEADRMLDMGFIDDVEYFLSKLSPETQKMLFSATTNEKVKELAFEYLENPKYISANPEVMTPERILQFAVICESSEKLRVMLGLLREHNPVCSVIFTNTKIVAEWLQYKLKGNGIEVDLITGDLPQTKRIALVQRIKNNEVKALIATDVASRGLHISAITHVYNFDLPDDAANYVHRIGRTARAGAEGSAYSLVCEDYGHNLVAIQNYMGENIAVNTYWFPEDFLQIEDKANNPYKDATFKGNRMKDQEERTGRSSARGKDAGRGGRDSRDGRGRPDKGPARVDGDREPKKPRQQARDRDRSPKDRTQEHLTGAQAVAKGQHPQTDRKPHKKAHTGTPERSSAPKAASAPSGDRKLKIIAPPPIIIKPVSPIKRNQEVPNSFMGLLRKIFSVFFKKK